MCTSCIIIFGGYHIITYGFAMRLPFFCTHMNLSWAIPRRYSSPESILRGDVYGLLLLNGSSVGPYKASIEGSGFEPRFSAEHFPGDEDLSDKSTYMTCLSAMKDHQFAGGEWAYSAHGNVEISIPDTNHALEVKHAMWGIFRALAYVGQ